MIKQEHISKKIWQKPELRVLCRGTSEENVLGGCKANTGNSYGPEGDVNHCRISQPHGPPYPCNIQTFS